MKKTLLFVFTVIASQWSFGQQAYAENFTALTIGNIGTDMTGATPGQGMWHTTSTNGATPTTTTNSDNSNFQVVDGGATYGNVLQITGPNGDKGSRIIAQPGIPAFWAGRTAGNDIMEVEYDFFTGPATTSKNNMRMVIYDVTGTKILAGLSFVMNTKVLSGVAYYDATAQGGMVGNYLFYLGIPVGTTPTNIVLPENTWVRIGLSYNYATGQVRWKGADFNGNVMGAAAANNPTAINMMATSGHSATSTPPNLNTVAATGLYDNVVARASATDTLLEVADILAVAQLSVYPNPINDVVNVTNSTLIKSIAITDLNGRVVKKVQLSGVSEASVNVSELSAGIYMMSIDSDSGQAVKKIVKN